MSLCQWLIAESENPLIDGPCSTPCSDESVLSPVAYTTKSNSLQTSLHPSTATAATLHPTIQQLIDMGFNKKHAEHAMSTLGKPSFGLKDVGVTGTSLN